MGIRRSPVDSPRKGQWRGALMCSLICGWIKSWANTREASELRHHDAHCDVTVMYVSIYTMTSWHENFLVSLALWQGTSVTEGFPAQKDLQKGAVMVLFKAGENKLLKEQCSCRWFKMPWCPCDLTLMNVIFDRISHVKIRRSYDLHNGVSHTGRENPYNEKGAYHRRALKAAVSQSWSTI